MTPETREVLFARESGETLFALLRFEHPSLAEPILISNDPTQRLTSDPVTYGTISRGNTYLYVPCAITLPDESEDATTSVQIEVENVDRSLTTLVRSIQGDATLEIEIVSTADLDSVIRAVAPMRVRVATISSSAVTIEAIGDELSTEAFPGNRFTADRYPALF